ncbi:MAG: hypothetical protein ACLP50_26385 [Solirubrobacteraceae bacterium]|jgi:hypothetical protein
MTELREVLGTIEYAQAPLRHRRWMATSYGNDMALGNASLASAPQPDPAVTGQRVQLGLSP